MKPTIFLSAITLALAAMPACDAEVEPPSNQAGGGGSSQGGGGAGPGVGGGGTGGEAGPGGGGGMGGAGPKTSPGCVDGAGLEDGEHTFMLEGRDRRFIIRLPANYSRDQAWPLVLALHGNGGNINEWDATSGSKNVRAVLENDAVLIVAEAIEATNGHAWRDYDLDSTEWPDRIESELLYFEEVLTQAKTELCLNEEAIFSMGFSGGGSFSGVLGCRRDDIRAIAVGGSVVYFNEDNCIHAPAAWISISEDDLSQGREDYRDHFRDAAGCDATSTATEPAECVTYDGCNAETPVHYCPYPGGHAWPDFGTQAMWTFFEPLVE